MQRDLAHFVDILESAKLTLSYIENISLEEFHDNYLIQDAVIRRIEIIGKAASKISVDSINKYPQLPWKEMKGMRNHLSYEHDELKLSTVWEEIKSKLPKVIEQITALL
jgi:uncharacterized protein with HEPN domain